MAETKFNDPSALRTKNMITPKDKLTDLGINLKKRLNVKVRVKKRGIKNAKSWRELAEVRVFGYGTFKMTYA